jgi:hypothetical protein
MHCLVQYHEPCQGLPRFLSNVFICHQHEIKNNDTQYNRLDMRHNIYDREKSFGIFHKAYVTCYFHKVLKCNY